MYCFYCKTGIVDQIVPAKFIAPRLRENAILKTHVTTKDVTWVPVCKDHSGDWYDGCPEGMSKALPLRQIG